MSSPREIMSSVGCGYVWRRTDRWITFPWSAEPPVGEALAAVAEGRGPLAGSPGAV